MAARLFAIVLGFLALTLSLAAPSPRRGPGHIGVPIVNPDASDVIPNSFVVVYNSTFDDDVITTHQNKWMKKIATANIGKRSLDGRALSTQATAIRLGAWRAMTLEADDSTMNQIFDADEVKYIEADVKVSLNTLSLQSNAPSGLVRLSHAKAGASGYIFDSSAGEGITAYVVDTGILTTHSEFGGRATFGKNFVPNSPVRLPFAFQSTETSASVLKLTSFVF